MKYFLPLPVLAFGLLAATHSNAQNALAPVFKELPKGWHLGDFAKDGYYGISIDKAYEFVKGKPSTPVIVATIDSGIDTTHEDLKPILWVNPREIPGNGIDDDNNGYVDDVHGWNFLGGKDGRNVKKDSDEASRVYHGLKAVFTAPDFDSTKLDAEGREQFEMWTKAKLKLESDAAGGGSNLLFMKRALESSIANDSILRAAMGKDTFNGNELEMYVPSTTAAQKAKAGMLYVMKAFDMMETPNTEFIDGFSSYVEGEERKRAALDSAPEDYRGEIVKDNYNDINDRYYGNNDVMAGTPSHGTHVAGIIAAKRGNSIGMDGVADNVRIMAIRAVPDGDEHDKDIALAIRYAVDNGAKVINMSFGKSFSPQKKWIDDAVKYADEKGVLLVHAAGNDAANVDSTDNFPSTAFLGGKERATNWVTVGASSDPLAEPGFDSYTASFSNYGKKEVDVFAPGTKIYSTLPTGNAYGTQQGTSMAAPVVAGVAAFVLSYYPKLTPEQLKAILIKSVSHTTQKVKVPGTDNEVDLAQISVSGGFVNAYEAVKLADALSKPAPPVKKAPKSTLKKSKKG
ncbi:MAG: S8 family peptidase [Flavihumibacter sp.]